MMVVRQGFEMLGAGSRSRGGFLVERGVGRVLVGGWERMVKG